MPSNPEEEVTIDRKARMTMVYKLSSLDNVL